MPAGSPVSADQRATIEACVASAERVSGLRFRVHVGALEGGRDAALRIHASCADPALTVLVAVDPLARLIEIVTGSEAALRLDDRSCGLAVLAMQSSFAAGDLVGGLRDGVRLLGDHARSQSVRHLGTA